jgi:glycosyltransferase involved in cell wall biosynthesis
MKFSVIVPTRKRPGPLSACLDSLAALDYPRAGFEVVVIDDGGGVPEGVVESFSSRLDVRLLTQRHAGPAAARNRGIEAARGEYVAFTDDDCLADPGWLRALERALIDHPQAIVGGATVNASAGSIYSRASQGIVDFLYEYYADTHIASRFFATNNLACRRDLLLAMGGFDESFPRAAAEDRDLCERWTESGRYLEFAGDARITHVLVVSLARYVRQHARYGQGANYLHRARARRTGAARNAVPPRLEPLRFYWRLVTWPLRSDAGWRALALMGLAALSQVAYGVGYYTERARLRLTGRTRELGHEHVPASDPAPSPSRVAAP